MLLAFVLNLFRVWRLERWPDTFLYSLANFFGGALATAAAAMIFYWPFVVYEGIWCFFSAVNCVRLGLRWQREQRQGDAKASDSTGTSTSSTNVSVDNEPGSTSLKCAEEQSLTVITKDASV